MGVPRFLFGLLREAPSKRVLVRSLAPSSRGGDRSVTSADGTRLSVRVTGQGVPLVMVHGTLDGIGAFSFVELPLAERYQVWVYDRRGRGGSGDGQTYDLAREVDDLVAVIRAAGAPCHVFGHCFGGVVALQAQQAGAPMRTLTVYEPPINGDTIPPPTVDAIRAAVADGRRDDAIRIMATDLAGLRADELAVAMRVPAVRRTLRDGVRVAPRELDTVRGRPSAPPAGQGVPTLVLLGERCGSAAYPTEEQARSLAPAVDVRHLPGEGHLGHVFSPTAFTEVLLSFIDQG